MVFSLAQFGNQGHGYLMKVDLLVMNTNAISNFR